MEEFTLFFRFSLTPFHGYDNFYDAEVINPHSANGLVAAALRKVFQSRSGFILLHMAFPSRSKSLCWSSHILMFVSPCDQSHIFVRQRVGLRRQPILE